MTCARLAIRIDALEATLRSEVGASRREGRRAQRQHEVRGCAARSAPEEGGGEGRRRAPSHDGSGDGAARVPRHGNAPNRGRAGRESRRTARPRPTKFREAAHELAPSAIAVRGRKGAARSSLNTSPASRPLGHRLMRSGSRSRRAGHRSERRPSADLRCGRPNSLPSTGSCGALRPVADPFADKADGQGADGAQTAVHSFTWQSAFASTYRRCRWFRRVPSPRVEDQLAGRGPVNPARGLACHPQGRTRTSRCSP